MSAPHPYTINDQGPAEAVLQRLFRLTGKRSALYAICWVMLIAYVPLLILSAINGTLWDNVDIPFLKDYATQMRALIAIPLLLVSRKQAVEKTLEVAKYVNTHLLNEQQRVEVLIPTFEKIKKLNTKGWSELIIGITVVIYSVLVTVNGISHMPVISSWQGSVTGSGVYLSAAGKWSIFVSVIIYRFIIFRWFWVYGCWFWLLIKISRCKLNLIYHHADKACGLHLLVFPQRNFNMFFVAFAIISSGSMINEVVYLHESFDAVKTSMIILVASSFILLLGPYLFFMPTLIAAAETQRIKISEKAAQLGEAYHKTWITTDITGTGDEKPDPSTMADFNSTYEIVGSIRPFPFNIRDLITLAIPIVAAFTPVLLTNMTPKELLELLMHFVI